MVHKGICALVGKLIYIQLCLMLLILLCMDSVVGISWSNSFVPGSSCLSYELHGE